MKKDIKKLFMNMVLKNKTLIKKEKHQFDDVQLVMTYGT
jgi:hypothetical protein